MITSSRFSSRWPCLALALVVAAAVLPFFPLSYYNHPFMDDYYNAANVAEPLGHRGLCGRFLLLRAAWSQGIEPVVVSAVAFF